jgi:hypothetical protein
MRPKLVEAKANQDQKLEMLVEYLKSIRSVNFTGYIKVNFSQGSIGRVEKFEEILKKG